MAADVSEDVIHLHGEDDQQKDRPIIPIVRYVAKITERASEEGEPEHTQTDALDVAFRLIRNQPADGNQRDGQGKQRNKEAIPVIELGKSDKENTDNDDETNGAFPEQPGNAGIPAVTKETERGHSEDGPKSACQNWNQDTRRQPNPGAIAIPQFLSFFGSAFGCSRRDENQEGARKSRTTAVSVKTIVTRLSNA